MSFALDKLIIKDHYQKSIQELGELPVAALKGVSPKDAALLQEAFNIKTINDLGANSFFLAAQGIQRAAMDNEYDPGPPPFWLQKFSELSDDYYLHHPSQRFRTAFGGVLYRGRLDNTARVLIIGQDPSTDEAIARRAFVGSAGQRLQKFLNKVGITRSYIIINTFAYSIKGQFDTEMRRVSLEPTLKTFRDDLINTFIKKNPIQAILTFGAGAKHALNHWENSKNITVFNLVHPTAPEQTTHPSWNDQLAPIADFLTPDDASALDLSPYSGNWDQTLHMADIPRYDLPYGLPYWHGTHGTNSKRDPADRVKNIIWQSI
ncbi:MULTISPECIES: uracil-DNA glycosylase family protein [Arenibacter]|uniref:uracil-DNA glycosylase family protein n=1 Tax=Arenibacter TaxID=178469 RepID=UPI000A3A2F64|nr:MULTISPECIES: uracil-DNA glycosylase family protein [Arenibacter]